jgi:FkbM family methyltransferase
MHDNLDAHEYDPLGGGDGDYGTRRSRSHRTLRSHVPKVAFFTAGLILGCLLWANFSSVDSGTIARMRAPDSTATVLSQTPNKIDIANEIKDEHASHSEMLAKLNLIINEFRHNAPQVPLPVNHIEPEIANPQPKTPPTHHEDTIVPPPPPPKLTPPPPQTNNAGTPHQVFFLNTSKCGGEPIDLGYNAIGLHHAIHKDFDPSSATSSGRLATVAWGPGLKMMTHGDTDLISKHLLTSGVWEPDNMQVFMSLAIHFKQLGKPLTVLDIGSNIGTFGLISASYGHRVIMFEPMPQNVERVCESVQLNGFGGHVTVVQAAVSDTHSELFMDPVLDNLGASRAHTGGGGIKVPVVVIDDIWPALKVSPDDHLFVKIDVEGMDYYVTSGAKHVLSLPNVVGIAIEHAHQTAPNITLRTQRLQELSAAGNFKVYCCVYCYDIVKEHGRCKPVDISTEESVKAAGVELLMIKDEYFPIVDRFDCRGKDHATCHPPLPAV